MVIYDIEITTFYKKGLRRPTMGYEKWLIGWRNVCKTCIERKGDSREDSYCWMLPKSAFVPLRSNQHNRLLWATYDPFTAERGHAALRLHQRAEINTASEVFMSFFFFFFCQLTGSRIDNAMSLVWGLLDFWSVQNIIQIQNSHDRASFLKYDKRQSPKISGGLNGLQSYHIRDQMFSLFMMARLLHSMNQLSPVLMA